MSGYSAIPKTDDDDEFFVKELLNDGEEIIRSAEDVLSGLVSPNQLLSSASSSTSASPVPRTFSPSLFMQALRNRLSALPKSNSTSSFSPK